MADRLFSTLAPRLNPSVPGCPKQTIIEYIRDAAIRVCERTLAWRYEQPKFFLLPGVHEYAYYKPATADVHAVFGVLVNDKPLVQRTLEQALQAHPEWADLYSGEDPSVVWSLTPAGAFNTFEYNAALFNENSPYVLPASIVAKAGTPDTICQVSPDKYIVLPLPNGDERYSVRMFYALKPKRTATGMDSVAFDELEDVILHGALQHLLVLPNVPWMDRELATYHGRQYVFHLSERRARANMGNVRGSMAARMQPF